MGQAWVDVLLARNLTALQLGGQRQVIVLQRIERTDGHEGGRQSMQVRVHRIQSPIAVVLGVV